MFLDKFLDKLDTSWSLVKASAAVLRHDRELLLLPVLSFLASLLVMASFILPMISLEPSTSETPGAHVAFWVLMFLFYLTQYFVIFFFNAALVGAASMRMNGEDPTLSDALSMARDVVGPLLGYAVIAATVGMILRAIAERTGFLGRVVAGLMGMGWTIATFLVVPVLVHRHMGPVDAVAESTRLLKKTWGQNVAGHVGIGLAFGLASFAIAMVGGALIVMLMGISQMLAIVFGATLLVALLALGVYQAALTGVYQAALYRYADTGVLPGGFSQDQIDCAFITKT